MADYRDSLYEKYFQNQAGRRLVGDLRAHIQEHWLHLEKEILPLIHTDKNQRILDMGCGYGELLMLLEAKGYKNTVGIDISIEQIEKAKEMGLSNVVVMDAFDYLAHNRGGFDIIIGIDIIEHFNPNELLKLLDLIRLALKPGGKAIFRTPNMDAPFTSTYAYGDFTHQSFMNYSSAMQLFSSAGYEKVEVLPSYIAVKGFMKELFRKVIWGLVVLQSKLILFGSGKSTQGVHFTPNIIIRVKK